MTATLYRRLVDLPPGYLTAYPDARTTDDLIEVGSKPAAVAELVRAAAVERGHRVLIAILSDPQADVIGTRPRTPECRKIVRVLERYASVSARTARTVDLSERTIGAGTAGKPVSVVMLWDGRIRPDVSQRSRSRRDKRFTLDSDVLRWVETESVRRGESQSAVVQTALRGAMGTR